MQLKPRLQKALDAAKNVASSASELINASALRQQDEGYSFSDTWSLREVNEHAFLRLKKAVADFIYAKDALDDINMEWVYSDAEIARKRLLAPRLSLGLGESDTGFNFGTDTKHQTAFAFTRKLAFVLEFTISTRGSFLVDEDERFTTVSPSKLGFFRGTVTAFGMPSSADLEDIHDKLEREAIAVQRLRSKHGTWGAIVVNSQEDIKQVFTEGEQAVVDFIRAKPFSTAKEIACGTGLVQSSIERHFSPKQKRRKLIKNRRGRGYYSADATD
jgi:hypothetical protein